MDGRVLDYVALGILISVAIIILYGIIYIHDIPYKIANSNLVNPRIKLKQMFTTILK